MLNLLEISLATGVSTLRNTPDKYNIIIRLWTNCSYHLLENLRCSSLTAPIHTTNTTLSFISGPAASTAFSRTCGALPSQRPHPAGSSPSLSLSLCYPLMLLLLHGYTVPVPLSRRQPLPQLRPLPPHAPPPLSHASMALLSPPAPLQTGQTLTLP
jgi:hypothetical protein